MAFICYSSCSQECCQLSASYRSDPFLSLMSTYNMSSHLKLFVCVLIIALEVFSMLLFFVFISCYSSFGSSRMKCAGHTFFHALSLKELILLVTFYIQHSVTTIISNFVSTPLLQHSVTYYQVFYFFYYSNLLPFSD